MLKRTYSEGKSGNNIAPGKGDFSTCGLSFSDSGPDSQDSYILNEGTVWDIVPGIKKRMYPHQQSGFEFMWKNLAGSIDLEKLKNSPISHGVGGCVISHAPGTGKTLLTIVFLRTYMEVYPTCRPVIIAPCSMLATWEEEFKKWKVDIPFHNLNALELSGKENKLLTAANNWAKKNTRRSINCNRMVKLLCWKKGKSILGIGYRLFQRLAGEGEIKKEQLGDIRKILLELPGLLVLDEGHTPRNDYSLIYEALSKIQTERRIILSGTPFQNNLSELYNILCLVRPKLASKEPKEKWTSLTSSIGNPGGVINDKIECLRAMIDPYVHVHKGSILENLPGLKNSLILLCPTPLQKSLLERIEETERSTFIRDYKLTMVSVHPSLLADCGELEKGIDKIMLQRLRQNPDEGVKTQFVIELIRLSEAMNEKVLVFSQYIDPLLFLKGQLISHFKWAEGMEILQMDGKLDLKQRQCLINVFNDPMSKVKVLLASTRSCSEGINLIGASRVVLLDVAWNPSVEKQAISRAYRIGQKKVVYTYHLITSTERERRKHAVQVKKDHLSQLLFSSTHDNGSNQNTSEAFSEDKILEEMVQHSKLKDLFEKIIYNPKGV